MNAPNFDHLIYVAQTESVVTDLDSFNILMLIIKELEVIEVQGDDEYRSFWFEVPRGNTEEIIQKATWFPPLEVTLSLLPD